MEERELDWHPQYNHRHQFAPPKTDLTMETASGAYSKLKDYWAIKIDSECPAGGWEEDKSKCHRHLFYKNGFHHPVRWMPELKSGWRRFTYTEFCFWYGIYN